MGDYCASWKPYIELLKKPVLEKWMFDCSGSWLTTYQQWNVIYFEGLLVMNLLRIPFASGGLVDALIDAFVSVVVCAFFTHLAWFCIVCNDACCGKVGYFIWAVLLFLSFFGRLSGTVAGTPGQGSLGDLKTQIYLIVYSLLIIPVFYMGISCFQLACGSSGGFKTRGVHLEADDSDAEAAGGGSKAAPPALVSSAPAAPAAPVVVAPAQFQAPVMYSAGDFIAPRYSAGVPANATYIPGAAPATYVVPGPAPTSYLPASYSLPLGMYSNTTYTAPNAAYTQLTPAPAGAVYTSPRSAPVAVRR